MLQNAYFLAKIGADTAENEQHFAEILPTDALWLAWVCDSIGVIDTAWADMAPAEPLGRRLRSRQHPLLKAFSNFVLPCERWKQGAEIFLAVTFFFPPYACLFTG